METGYTPEGLNAAKLDLLIETLARVCNIEQMLIAVYSRQEGLSKEEMAKQMFDQKVKIRQELYDYIFAEHGTVRSPEVSTG